MSSKAFHLAQVRWESQEDPRFAEEALEDAVDARIDQIFNHGCDLSYYTDLDRASADAFAAAFRMIDKDNMRREAAYAALRAVEQFSVQLANSMRAQVREELLSGDYVGD